MTDRQRLRLLALLTEPKTPPLPLTYSSCVSLVCTGRGPGAVPPGVADAVGHGGGEAGLVTPRQGLKVVLHEPLSPPHLVHTLHAEKNRGFRISFFKRETFSCRRNMFPVIRLNRGASPFPGYDRKVFVFPHVHPPPNSHVYDYFPIAKAIIQVPLVSQQSGEVLSFPNCCDCLRYQSKLTKFRCPSCCTFSRFQ